MKKYFLILGALLMVSTLRIEPATAMSTDHGSEYANTDGSSRFSDPDDQVSPDQFGTVLFGNSSTDGSSSGGSFTLGMSATNNGQANSIPGIALGCVPGINCSK